MRTAHLRESDERGEVPTSCPSCGSRDVVTTSKAVTTATYWRCEACGDVWNIDRQRKAGRYLRSPAYGR